MTSLVLRPPSAFFLLFLSSFLGFSQAGLSASRLVLNLAEQKPQKQMTHKQVAEAFLREKYAQYGIEPHLKNIRLIREQKSLLGRHFTYQQILGESPVKGSILKVSVLEKEKTIFKVFTSLKEIDQIALSESKISKEEAFDKAWNHLKVRGHLFHAPKIKTHYFVKNGVALLTYQVELAVSFPYGYWIYQIDAQTGQILDYIDQRVDYGKKKSLKKPWDDQETLKPLTGRKKAFFEFFQKKQKIHESTSNISRQNGVALVFDPDPRTRLNDENIEDDSPHHAFEEAYSEGLLKELLVKDGLFHLEGPFVALKDFDPPQVAPTTSLDGHWSFKRGNNGFNDVMTYYHIDKNQRYIQSLGFTGDKGIQNGPITIDSNGAGGSDNSYYQPNTNSLSFGHGCVDDNEDADVILHEYGHAIQFSINSDWEGGDTGAIGEGFGDYWAASYSYSTEHGKSYLPFEVFSWDAHGSQASCWEGRILNANDLRYDPSRTYGAHQPMPHDRQSDELWSTPLFQSLVTLMEMDIPRSDMDTIVLESHFGLGPGTTMRDMARSMLQTARLLFPGGPHERVLKEKFSHHKIIEIPMVELKPNLTFHHAGANGAADPLETLRLKLEVENVGRLFASNVHASLLGSPAIMVQKGVSPFGDIGIGYKNTNAEELVIKMADIACGDTARLEVELTYNQNHARTFPIDIPTGIPDGVEKMASPHLDIPDNDTKGIFDTLLLEGENAYVSREFKVHIALHHTYVGDLDISLISPEGTKITLHKKTGGSAVNIIGVYGKDLISHDSLTDLEGERLTGKWKLRVKDHSNLDIGKLISWGITDIKGHICQ